MNACDGLVVLLGLTGTLSAQVMTSVAERADAYIKSAAIQGSVLLAKGGKVILARGYGLANIELGVANKPETNFVLVPLPSNLPRRPFFNFKNRGNSGSATRSQSTSPTALRRGVASLFIICSRTPAAFTGTQTTLIIGTICASGPAHSLNSS